MSDPFMCVLLFFILGLAFGAWGERATKDWAAPSWMDEDKD